MARDDSQEVSVIWIGGRKPCWQQLASKEASVQSFTRMACMTQWRREAVAGYLQQSANVLVAVECNELLARFGAYVQSGNIA